VLGLYEANINASLILQSTDKQQSLQGTLVNNAPKKKEKITSSRIIIGLTCMDCCSNRCTREEIGRGRELMEQMRTMINQLLHHKKQEERR